MPNPETRERSLKIGRQSVEECMPFNCPHCNQKLFGYESKCPQCDKRVKSPPKMRVVYDQWPLKRLSVRGTITRVQFNAGEAYSQHWRASGMSPLTSVDMTRMGSGSDQSVPHVPASIRQAEHRKLYRLGYNALLLPNRGKIFVEYVEAIVLYDQEPKDVGKLLTKRTADDHAGAVAIEFLRVGLDLLADAYQMST